MAGTPGAGTAGAAGTPGSPGSAGAGGRCGALAIGGTRLVDVTTADALVAAVGGAQVGDTILIADGTYALGGRALEARTRGVTVRGKSGDRSKVVLDAAYAQGAPDAVVVTGTNVTVAHVTIAHAYDHGIRVVASAGSDAGGARIHDVHVLDPGAEGIVIDANAAGDHVADDGAVSCSRVELTDAGRALVRGCATGGIDLRRARRWRVQDNVVTGFWCGSGLAGPGIAARAGSRDTTVERNTVTDCARGIGLGGGAAPSGDAWRTYLDAPCAGAAPVGHYGGVVRNNVVWAGRAELFSAASGFDTGIALEQACDAIVVHDTVVAAQAPRTAAVGWQYANTRVEVANDLSSHPLKSLGGGAQANLAGNLTSATNAYFVDGAKGDLHLQRSAPAIDIGVSVAAGVCDDDIDAQPRTGARDVGADEVP